MKELVRKWLPVLLLFGIAAAFAVSAAFLCAGLVMLVLAHTEVAVLFVFALWLLWFGWRTKDDLPDDGEDGTDGGDVILFNRYC